MSSEDVDRTKAENISLMKKQAFSSFGEYMTTKKDKLRYQFAQK